MAKHPEHKARETRQGVKPSRVHRVGRHRSGRRDRGSGGGLAAEPQTAALPVEAGEMTAVTLTINGRRMRLLVEATVVRYSTCCASAWGSPGPRRAASAASAASAPWLMDDKPRYSCLTLASRLRARRSPPSRG